MKKFKEIKEIAKCMEKAKKLAEQLEEKIETSDIDWETAHFVSMSKEELSHLDLVDDEYYVKQYQGYI